jgi:choline kinase
MEAIILAAGVGRRLRDRHGQPKCLQTVGGVSLVRHQLASLASVGITDVVMVVGHAQERVRASLGSRVSYVVNRSYRDTNSLYSFLLAAQQVHDEVVVMNSDVFFHPALLGRLLEAGSDALLYDSASGHEDEHMKVRISHDHVVEMSKTLSEEEISGENVGILRLSESTLRDVVSAARTIVAAGGRNAWLATAITRVARDHSIACVDVAPWPWVEIDFPEDLVRARAEVLPAVASELADLPWAYAEPMTIGGAQ